VLAVWYDDDEEGTEEESKVRMGVGGVLKFKLFANGLL
jgi:hypothetical protein